MGLKSVIDNNHTKRNFKFIPGEGVNYNKTPFSKTKLRNYCMQSLSRQSNSSFPNKSMRQNLE